MHPTDTAKELWRCQASENVDSHDVLCVIDETVCRNIRQAALNWRKDNHLVAFDEYKNL